MPQFQKLILALCVAFVLAVLGVAQASAGVKASPRPTVVVDQDLSVANIATVKCWGGARMPWSISWLRRSTAGIPVWRYGLTITDFCWTGRQIVIISSRRWAKVHAPLWDFTGHIGEQRTWNAKWSFRRWTEGRFVWAGPVGIAVRTPEVWFKVRGDGYLSYGAVGD